VQRKARGGRALGYLVNAVLRCRLIGRLGGVLESEELGKNFVNMMRRSVCVKDTYLGNGSFPL
jgi:hypothetical protein